MLYVCLELKYAIPHQPLLERAIEKLTKRTTTLNEFKRHITLCLHYLALSIYSVIVVNPFGILL